MTDRRVPELTRGATLMLNPNRDHVTLYPPEVSAVLEGRSLGHYTHEAIEQAEQVRFCQPPVPTDALVLALQGLFAREPAVRAAYLVELHRGADLSDISLMLTLAVTKSSEVRLVQLTALELNSLSQPPDWPSTCSACPRMRRCRSTAVTTSSSMELDPGGGNNQPSRGLTCHVQRSD